MRKEMRDIQVSALMSWAAFCLPVFADSFRRQENIAGKTGEFFARGRSRVYAGEYLDAISMPLGGIGSGSLPPQRSIAA